MRKSSELLILFIFILAFACNKKSETKSAYTIYAGGDILTMVGDTPLYAEALLVQNGKILFVGSIPEAQEKAGNNYTSIDLKGKTMIPGLIDGHSHFGAFSVQAIGAQI